jgi:hypothetical protein
VIRFISCARDLVVVPGALIAVLAIVEPQQAPAYQQPNPGAISGVVVDATTGRPVAGAIVSLGRTDPNIVPGQPVVPLPRVATDARGRFVFRDLPPSPNYFLGARRFGYTYTRYGWTKPNGPLTISDILRIAVGENQWVSDIKIPLWRLGSISGRVVDERGEPAVGVAVRTFSVAKVSGQNQLVAGDLAVTDDRGVYRIPDLERGRYVVAVLSVQSTVLTSTVENPQRRAIGEIETGGIGAGRGSTISLPAIDVDGRHRLAMSNFATPPPPSADDPRAYPPVFYPAARTVQTADFIQLDYGDARSGVDFQLQPVRTFRLSGLLTGAPVPADFLLRLLPAGAERLGFGSEVATTLVDKDGSFTFLNVPEGQYTLLAQASVMDFTTGSAQSRLPDAPGFPGGGISVGSMSGAPGLSYLTRSGAPSSVWSRMSVDVGSQDISGLVVLLHPTVKIVGRLAFAEGTPVPALDRALLLGAQPANGDPSLGQPIGFTTRSDPTFSFAIDGLFGGRYLLRSSFLSYGVVSVVWDGREVRDSGFDASAGTDFTGVVVTLTDKKIEINGTVSDARPSGRAAVLVFPVDPARWTNYAWDATAFKTARAGSNGSFQIQNLPAGDFNVIAVDASQIDEWTDPDFLKAAAPLAQRVTLKWGDKSTVNLAVAPVSKK